MRILNFAKRNFKELIRDPLSLVFAILLPLFLLFFFQQFDIPNDSYKIENFTAGILVFGFSFISLFTAMLISKDRTTALLNRLGISPMRSAEYILGYILSLFPLLVLQVVLFFFLAICLGLPFQIHLLWAGLVSLVIAILFIAIGILIGSIFTEKASSGISSILVQLVCFTSGMYFPKELLGDTFGKICEYLPFEPAVILIKGIMNHNLEIIRMQDWIIFSLYTIVILALAIYVFEKKMKQDHT